MTTASTGLLCWRDFHPLEWQLASLHQIRTGPIKAYGLYGAFLVKRGRSATFSFLSSFFAFLALFFVRPRRRLSSAPTARCQSRRAQRQSRTARFSAPPGRALSLTDVRTAACCNGRVRLD